MIHREIVFFGKPCVLACDAQCDKAWGINGGRPRVEIDPADPDDFAYLADHEVGTAAEDPGTYEGGEAKPTAYGDPGGRRLNKWCARECERSAIADTLDDIALPDYTRRLYNIPSSNPETGDA